MGDGNWGALASGQPESIDFDENSKGGGWFQPPNYLQEEQYTIMMLKPWVLNQQPAHISALADQFQKAHDLLVEVEKSIREQSNKLYNETWTDSKARGEFMQRGPGKVLAYLQDWQQNILRNVTALRALVGPIRTSQADMQSLWARYELAVAHAGNADNLSFKEKVDAAGIEWYDGIGIAAYKYLNKDDGVKGLLVQKVEEVRKEYNRLARELVQKLSYGAYSDAFWHMIGGVGPTYAPPNVTMMPPGQKLVIPPGAAGLPPSFAGGAPSPPVFTPPSMVPQALLPPPSALPPVAPVLPKTPAVPNLPTQLTGLHGPGEVPTAPGLPGGGLLPGALPAGLKPGALPGTGKLTSATGPGFGTLTPPAPGTGLSKGVLRNPGAAPGLGAAPPPGGAARRRNRSASTLRSPAAYTATGDATGLGSVPSSAAPSGALPPPAGHARRRQALGEASGVANPAVHEAFSQSSLPPPVSPVLGRPAAGRRPEGAPASSRVQGSFIPPSAVPPVLNARAAKAPPPAAPARRTRDLPRYNGISLPPGGIPPQRSIRRHGAAGHDEVHLVGNPDWLTESGPDDSAISAPVLRNQATVNPTDAGVGTGAVPPTQAGATSPVLRRPRDAVREAMAQNRTRPGARRTPVEADLTRRALEVDHRGTPVVEEQPQVRDGEEAFTVQTPGGPVVGNTPDTGPKNEPKPTIGHG